MKNNLFKPYIKWLKKQSLTSTNIFLPGLVIVGLILSFSFKKSVIADNGAAQGFFGGAATGALVGGLAGGGRGAAIGAGVGGFLGLAAGSASDNGGGYDPYRQLDREQVKLNKLQDRLARARRPDQQASLQRQIDLQMSRIQDLQNRLGGGQGGARPGYQPTDDEPRASYQRPNYGAPQGGYARPNYQPVDYGR